VRAPRANEEEDWRGPKHLQHVPRELCFGDRLRFVQDVDREACIPQRTEDR
jgi:hypothetical protein